MLQSLSHVYRQIYRTDGILSVMLAAGDPDKPTASISKREADVAHISKAERILHLPLQNLPMQNGTMEEGPTPSPELTAEKMRTKREKTMIIFDWDDTILPTTHMTVCDYITPGGDMATFTLHYNLRRMLQMYERDVLGTLIQIYEMCTGNLLIITNGDSGWVEQSAAKFLPKIHTWLHERRIPIISARGQYELMFPGEPFKWKAKAFLVQLRRAFKGRTDFTLISIGDSLSEAYATQLINSVAERSSCKTIKLKEDPSIVDLTQQFFTIAQHLPRIIAEDASSDYTYFQLY